VEAVWTYDESSQDAWWHSFARTRDQSTFPLFARVFHRMVAGKSELCIPLSQHGEALQPRPESPDLRHRICKTRQREYHDVVAFREQLWTCRQRTKTICRRRCNSAGPAGQSISFTVGERISDVRRGQSSFSSFQVPSQSRCSQSSSPDPEVHDDSVGR
jgi:hypothetical protein